MGGATVDLRRADVDSLPYVEALLEENDLPARDVREKPDCFYIGYEGDDRIGVGGVEIHGPYGLVRSVVVERRARGIGYGTAICGELEAVARTNDVESLYLLTTTASGFFADHGYREIERPEAPPAIRRTSQFAELCPASATCMAKSIDP